MDTALRKLGRVNMFAVAIAFACTVMTSADFGQSVVPALPIAYTQAICVIPPTTYFCYTENYVVTPTSATAGPNDAWPSWSPDGTRIVFSSDGDLVVMDAAATTFLNITNTASSEWFPAWSPDGQRIAFVSDRDGQTAIYLMKPDGTDVVRVAVGPGFGRATWSPDSTRLAYSCVVDPGNEDICAINVDGSGFLRLTSDPGRDSYPAWSPDGATIAFSTARYAGELRLALMSSDGTNVMPIGAGIFGFEPAWSRDGSQIAFTGSSVYGEFGIAIYTMRADGSGISLMAVDAFGPVWAPSPLPLFASFTIACNGFTCTFDASRSIAATTYTWDFGDQTTGSGVVATHTYADGGSLTITLTVSDAEGATAVSQTSTYLNRPPVASFTVSCDSSLTCVFDGTASNDPDGSTLHDFEWRFGDGTRMGGPTVATHTFMSGGTYTVTLQVTDDFHTPSPVARHTVTLATPLMHVGDLDGSNSGQNGTWTATVTIEVHRANHTPVSNAAVTASWNSGATASCTTNAAGHCVVSRFGIPPSKTASLAVTSVAHPVFAYSPAVNHDPDGDSNGTTISISRR